MRDSPDADQKLHQIVIVGGGAGGLELATRLGDKLGRKKRARITLIEKARTHIWKPKLHEIAAGSMDIGDHEVAYLAQAHWHGFRFRIGRMTGLDRSTREVHVAPFVDEDGAEVTPARSFPYDTLVIAVGSQSNDFGTPGVREHALKLETVADARRFHMRMVNACVRAHDQRTPLRPEQLHVAIIGAGATGVEVHTEARVAEVLADGVRLADGRILPAELVVWAAGVKGAEFLTRLDGLETNRINQLVVRQTLQTTADDHIFALGDCAACPWPEKNGFVPPRAQAAHQQASHLYKQLQRRIAGKPVQDYRYRDFGSLVSLGEFSTVGNMMGGLTNGDLFIEGWFARMMYTSLYKMHELALHGWVKVTLDTLARMITRRTEPHVKLH